MEDKIKQLWDYHDQLREELNYFGAFVVKRCLAILGEEDK